MILPRLFTLLPAFAVGLAATSAFGQTDPLPRAPWPDDLRAAASQAPGTVPPGQPVRMAPQPAAGSARGARLTIAELERIAQGNNPTLAQAIRRVQALEGECVQVGLLPNPLIGYQGEEMGDEGRAGQQGAFLEQEIVTAGKLRLNRAVVGHEIRQARYALQSQRWRVLNDVRAAAYEVMTAQRTVDLDRELLRIGEDGVRTAEALLKAQEVSRVDVLQARVEANTAKIQLDDAHHQYRSAWRRLAAVVGVPGMEPVALIDTLGDSVPELDWPGAMARLMAQSPELAEARAGVQRARCARQRACAERVPNVDVAGAVRYNHASEYTIATVEFGLPLQIFDRNQGNILKADAELAAACREVERIELVLQDRLAESFRQYASAKQQVDRYTKEILPDAQTSLDLVRLGYEQGEFGYLEMLTAQRTFFRVNLAYVESLRQLWTSTAKIEGMLVTGGLQRPQ